MKVKQRSFFNSPADAFLYIGQEQLSTVNFIIVGITKKEIASAGNAEAHKAELFFSKDRIKKQVISRMKAELILKDNGELSIKLPKSNASMDNAAEKYGACYIAIEIVFKDKTLYVVTPNTYISTITKGKAVEVEKETLH